MLSIKKKLEHLDDISFKELFGQIRVILFYKYKIFVSTVAIIFNETQFACHKHYIYNMYNMPWLISMKSYIVKVIIAAK